MSAIGLIKKAIEGKWKKLNLSQNQLTTLPPEIGR
jgi:hypothetical protein